jgi:membrane-associated phospholipid phosphatase
MNTRLHLLSLAAALALTTPLARADAVTDWNHLANAFIVESKLGTPPAVRVMALLQTAVLQAVEGARSVDNARTGADLDAAVAAANRTVLTRLLPAQQAGIDKAYQAALQRLADGPARHAGVAAGERAATAVLAARADDGAAATVDYRPLAQPGAYVPTVAPAAPHWGQRKPWLLTNGAQVRPAAPPALDSDRWARDVNETRTLGRRDSTQRSAEQTEIARFWEFSLPSIYFGAVHAVAQAPGRDVARNARLFAATAQAMDDALIAVFDAKYHYNLWRPVTAIRNGDLDGHAATPRDAAWLPLIDNPMHPEYPSGHAILAGAVGTVLQDQLADGSPTTLSTTSPSAKGARRQWSTAEAFAREIAESRILAGIHFRFSTDTGLEMGRQIGTLAVKRHLQPSHDLAAR